ncbi:CLD12 protein, partial [Atractosteus spatula]|nr:CLD12 protein [Atractosteus spatula]
MTCRDIHATTVFAFVIALFSVGGLVIATLIPQWRVTALTTFNKNAKNVTVYDGLWAKCVRLEGSTNCLIFDSEWYSRVDQLDLRVLQFALPISIFFSSLSLFLGLTGMCKTACCSDVPDVPLTKCLVNSAGCHLVAGIFYFLSGGIGMAPSVWFIFYTSNLNKKFDHIFSTDFAAYVAIGSSGGLLLAACLLFLWYCLCKTLPSPFWLPLYSQPAAVHAYPPHSPPSNSYSSPVYPSQACVPQSYGSQVSNPQAYVSQTSVPQGMAPHTYMSQISAPDGYGSEVCASQAYAPQSYTSQSYGSPNYRYSTRSRLSTIEIDIPLHGQAY